MRPPNTGLQCAHGVSVSLTEFRGVATAITLSRRTMATMRQDLFRAFADNVVGIPVAAGLLCPIAGLLPSPILASAAMAFRSVRVVTNSLRLQRA